MTTEYRPHLLTLYDFDPARDCWELALPPLRHVAQQKYTAENDAYIRDRWGKDPVKSIAAYLGRSENGVRNRAKFIGLPNILDLPSDAPARVADRRFSPEEDQYIRDNWGDGVARSRSISEHLGRSRGCVYSRAAKLGLHVAPHDLGPFTAAEDHVIKDCWGRDAPEAIGATIGRSAGAVMRRAVEYLGLPKFGTTAAILTPTLYPVEDLSTGVTLRCATEPADSHPSPTVVVGDAPSRRGRSFTFEEDQEIRRCWKEPKPDLVTLAAKLGRSTKTIHTHALRSLGLPHIRARSARVEVGSGPLPVEVVVAPLQDAFASSYEDVELQPPHDRLARPSWFNEPDIKKKMMGRR